MILKINDFEKCYNSLKELCENYDNSNVPIYKKGNKIHIKKENRGKFTKSAKAAGQSVQEHARAVLNDPNATPLQKKRANFARNAAKWKHQEGGVVNRTLPIKEINTGYFNDDTLITDKSGNQKNWKDILQQDPNYQIYVDENEKPIFNRKELNKVEGTPNINPFQYMNTPNYLRASQGYKDYIKNSSSGMEILNAMSLGLLNRLSLSQNVGSIRDIKRFANGEITGNQLAKSIVDGNTGFLNEESYNKNPITGEVVNFVGDMFGPGVTKAGVRGIEIANQLRPSNLRKHIYMSKAPFGYSFGDTPKKVIKGVLSGKTPDIDNPEWFNDETIKKILPNITNETINTYGKHALKARDDAWRKYLKLPERWGIFTENSNYPGTFTDVQGIENLKGMEIPPQIKGNYQYDFVNSSGGNVGIPVIHDYKDDVTNKIYGITTTTDIWDLHPFRKEGNTLLNKITNKNLKRDLAIQNGISSILEGSEFLLKHNIKKARQFVKNNNIDTSFGIEDNIINKFQYPENSIRYKLGTKVKFLSNELNNLYDKRYNWIKPLSDKLSNFEVGKLVGAKPFTVVNEIPWTRKFDIDNKEFKYIGGHSFRKGGKLNKDYNKRNISKVKESIYRQTLPNNLKYTDSKDYNMERASKLNIIPTLENDGYYHLPTRDPSTGLILKKPTHDTFKLGLYTDVKEGYYPRFKNGEIYTVKGYKPDFTYDN